MGDRYNIHSQLEHLQSKYIGTGKVLLKLGPKQIGGHKRILISAIINSHSYHFSSPMVS